MLGPFDLPAVIVPAAQGLVHGAEQDAKLPRRQAACESKSNNVS